MCHGCSEVKFIHVPARPSPLLCVSSAVLEVESLTMIPSSKPYTWWCSANKQRNEVGGALLVKQDALLQWKQLLIVLWCFTKKTTQPSIRWCHMGKHRSPFKRIGEQSCLTAAPLHAVCIRHDDILFGLWSIPMCCQR